MLGKYALYDWLTKGTNVGIQTQTKLGPFSSSVNQGFEITKDQDGNENQIGDYWYEPLSGGQVVFDEDLPAGEVVELPSEEENSQFFGINGGLALGPIQLNGGFGVGR